MKRVHGYTDEYESFIITIKKTSLKNVYYWCTYANGMNLWIFLSFIW